MSKSRKNIVDPEEMINIYGADSIRWFMLSDSPPDRDLDWTEAGIQGAWRYVNRLWCMISEPKLPLIEPNMPMPNAMAGAVEEVRRTTHQTIARVGEDLDRFHFNKAVARIRELTNLLDDLNADDAGASDAQPPPAPVHRHPQPILQHTAFSRAPARML